MRAGRRTTNDERRTTIDLRIEELVLHGFSPSEARRVGSTLEVELGRLLGGGDPPQMLAADAEIASIDAGRISSPTTAKPEFTSAELAKAIFGGLSHGQ